MRKRTFLYSLAIILLIGYSQQVTSAACSGGLYAQDDSNPSQKNIKKEKKKRMKEAVDADNAALKRHHDIQTKATRKRMKQHLRQTKKNIKNSHR